MHLRNDRRGRGRRKADDRAAKIHNGRKHRQRPGAPNGPRPPARSGPARLHRRTPHLDPGGASPLLAAHPTPQRSAHSDASRRPRRGVPPLLAADPGRPPLAADGDRVRHRRRPRRDRRDPALRPTHRPRPGKGLGQRLLEPRRQMACGGGHRRYRRLSRQLPRRLDRGTLPAAPACPCVLPSPEASAALLPTQSPRRPGGTADRRRRRHRTARRQRCGGRLRGPLLHPLLRRRRPLAALGTGPRHLRRRPLFYFATRRFTGRIRQVTRRQRAADGALTSVVEETLVNVVLTQAYNRQHDEEERLVRKPAAGSAPPSPAPASAPSTTSSSRSWKPSACWPSSAWAPGRSRRAG